MKKIAVIAGAGPAGLTAAYELLKRTDIQPIVFEATDAIGGIAQTYNFKGNRIDIGGHRFFSKSERVMKWWFNILPPQGAPAEDTEEKGHEIDYAVEVIIHYLCPECSSGKEEKRPAPHPDKDDEVMLQRPRLSRIYYRHNFFAYPLSITLSVAMRLGLLNTFLIGLSYIKARILPLKDESYLDSFFINRFGKRLYRTFFEDYTEKVWGIPCNQIRADWGSQRVKGLSLKKAIAHAIKDLLSSDFKKQQKERETSLITRFYYPKYGPGQMWETVAEHIRACGGDVRLNHRVSGVKEHDGKIVSVTVEDVTTGDTQDIACDYFFSSMPIKHLIGMMHPHPPDSACEVADGLQYRDFLTVGLLLKELHVKEKRKPIAKNVPDNWIYVQDNSVRVGRIQIFNNWSPYMVKDCKNTVWIGLEYFVNEGGDLWVMSDEDLIALSLKEMEQIGFLQKEDMIDGYVQRMQKAYPAYFGSYDQLHIVRDFVQKIPNLFLIGRNGMHRYNNQDHSMLTAMTAVDNIIEGRTDQSNIWNINLETEYHEEKK